MLTPCEGCREEWEGGDVAWLGLRLDDQLDAGSGLEGLGEVALLAEGNDVVVKGLWRLRSEMMEPPDQMRGDFQRLVESMFAELHSPTVELP
jgi:hypothetical protein